MIRIRLNPTLFNPGGLFYAVPKSRAVLTVMTGKPEGYLGQRPVPYGLGSPSYRGGQNALLVDASGTEMSDYMLEHHMVPSGNSRNSFGQIILDFVERALIIVEKNGTPLTAAQLNSFTA